MNVSFLIESLLEHKREGSMKQMNMNEERKIGKEKKRGVSKSLFPIDSEENGVMHTERYSIISLFQLMLLLTCVWGEERERERNQIIGKKISVKYRLLNKKCSLNTSFYKKQTSITNE